MNYYSILGVENTATKEDIKKAYYKLAKEKHPDKGGDEEEFKRINEAYAIIGDEQKRRVYDNKISGININDLFTPREYKRFGEDIKILLNLTLEEIHEGMTREIVYNRNDKCENCHGVGGEESEVCTTCNGYGYVEKVINRGFAHFVSRNTCHSCGGDGAMIKNYCNACNGFGVITKENKITATIPKGILDGFYYTTPGAGHFVRGGEFGNLLIKIGIRPHHKFIREGNDLIMNLPLSQTQLFFGCKIMVETIGGSLIKVTIPEKSNVGENMLVRGMGLNVMGNESARGNMFLKLKLDMKEEYTKEELDLMKKILKIEEKLNENKVF